MPLHFINEESSPAVKLNAAIVNHTVTELEIACLPKNLPQFIEVDLGNLIVGNPVHLSDVKLPIGVTYVSHGGEANPVLATANATTADTEPTEGEDAAPAA